MKHFLIILSLLLIFAMPSCETEPLKKNKPPNPTLPPITTEGKNTFGCMVDGKPYVPIKPSQFKSALITEYYDSRSPDLHGTLKIGAYRFRGGDGEPYYQLIEMRLNKRVFSAGKYILHTDSISWSSDFFRNYTKYEFGPSTWDREFNSGGTYNPHSGEMNILRLDTTYGKRIISGTFWFDAVDYVTKDTVQIREGRFDFKLY